MIGTLTASVIMKTVKRMGARSERVAGVSATSASVNRFARSRSPTTSASASCILFS